MTVPTDIAQNMARLQAMLSDFIQKVGAIGDSSLIEKANEFRRTFNAIQFIDIAGGNFDGARREITKLLNELVPFLRNVNQRLTPGAGEQSKAQAGSSFGRQLMYSLGLDPGTDMYVPSVPGGNLADAIGISSNWILPIGAGLLLLLLLRR